MGVTDPKGRPTTPTVEFFANQVAEQSKGSVRLEVSWNAGEGTGEGEQTIARKVKAGALDLGWIGSRAWDTEGVTGLQALQAPFLITDNKLMIAVASSPMATDMLAGLKDRRGGGLGPVSGPVPASGRVSQATGIRPSLQGGADPGADLQCVGCIDQGARRRARPPQWKRLPAGDQRWDPDRGGRIPRSGACPARLGS